MASNQNLVSKNIQGSREEHRDHEVGPSASASRKDYAIIAAFCISNFFVQVFYSLMAPFYPSEATEKKQVPPEIMGLIIGIYELALVLTAPILGKYITEIGTKFMFIAGHFVCGTCSILFGLLDLVPPGGAYIALSLIIRAMEGASSAGINTASFAIVGHRFPDRVATLFGTLEIFSGLGMMLGPSIGTALYAIDGFWVPFVICGALLMIVGVVCIFLIPSSNDIQTTVNLSDDHNDENRATVFGMLSIPLVFITGLNVIMGSAAIGFMTATLEEQLENVYGIKKKLYIGLVCTVGPLFYMLFAPVWGVLADKVLPRHSAQLVIIGYLLASLSFWFMGPAPFFHIHIPDTNPALLIIAQAVLGGGIAAFVVTFRMIAKVAKTKYSESFATFGVISGLFNSFFSCGAFAGPLIGSVMLGKNSLGFAWGTFIMGCLVLASACLLTGFTIWHWCKHQGHPQDDESTPEERRGLLQADT